MCSNNKSEDVQLEFDSSGEALQFMQHADHLPTCSGGAGGPDLQVQQGQPGPSQCLY